MSSTEPVKKILSSQMDRRQFLGFMGAATLVVTGVGGILSGLKGIQNANAKNGYGSSAYGGGQDSPAKRRLN